MKKEKKVGGGRVDVNGEVELFVKIKKKYIGVGGSEVGLGGQGVNGEVKLL